MNFGRYLNVLEKKKTENARTMDLEKLEKPASEQTNETHTRICQLPDEEKLRICKEALNDELVSDTQIKLLENTTVLPQQFYDVLMSRYMSAPPVTLGACLCPTNPPVYLRDESVENEIFVYVSPEENYFDALEELKAQNSNESTTESKTTKSSLKDITISLPSPFPT